MNKYIVILLLAFSGSAFAADKGTVEELSLSRCQLGEVIGRLKFESVKNAGIIAEQSISVSDEMLSLLNKLPKSDKPVSELLTESQLVRFTELTSRQKTIQLSALIESRRQRDLDVLEKMAKLADHEMRWGEQPDEKDPDFTIYAFLYYMRITISNEVTTPSTSICSLDYVFHSLMKESLNSINDNSDLLGRSTKELKAILKKYAMEKLDRSKLSQADLQKVNHLVNNVFNPLNRHRNFITDMENLKLMGKASLTLYEANKQDIAFSGGDMNALGMTLRSKADNNEIAENMLMAMGFWTKINEEIPAQWLEDWPVANE